MIRLGHALETVDELAYFYGRREVDEQVYMAWSPLNSSRSQLKSWHTSMNACSSAFKCPSVNTLCLYFATLTNVSVFFHKKEYNTKYEHDTAIQLPRLPNPRSAQRIVMPVRSVQESV